MSHFTLLVTVDGSVKENMVAEAVAAALAPFNENTQVEPYIRNTKAQLIENERTEIKDYEAGMYAKFLENPKAYIASTNNRGHLRYLGVPQLELPAVPSFPEDPDFFTKLEMDDVARDEARASKPVITEEDYLANITFPEKLARVDDDEFLFKLASRWLEKRHEEDEDGDVSESGLDEDGNEWSQYNPKSQWDWWTIGGRWSGMLNNTAGKTADTWNGKDILRRRDLRVPESTFAYLTKDGEWVEKGSMGWFGMSHGDEDQVVWDKKMAEYLLTVPGEDWLVVVDCHI